MTDSQNPKNGWQGFIFALALLCGPLIGLSCTAEEAPLPPTATAEPVFQNIQVETVEPTVTLTAEEEVIEPSSDSVDEPPLIVIERNDRLGIDDTVSIYADGTVESNLEETFKIPPEQVTALRRHLTAYSSMLTVGYGQGLVTLESCSDCSQVSFSRRPQDEARLFLIGPKIEYATEVADEIAQEMELSNRYVVNRVLAFLDDPRDQMPQMVAELRVNGGVLENGALSVSSDGSVLFENGDQVQISQDEVYLFWNDVNQTYFSNQLSDMDLVANLESCVDCVDLRFLSFDGGEWRSIQVLVDGEYTNDENRLIVAVEDLYGAALRQRE